MVAENKIIPAANKIMKAGEKRSGRGGQYQVNTPGRKKERRKTLHDRRRGVRDGVIVVLSFEKDRRKNPDRRFQASVMPVPTDGPKGAGYDVIA